MSGQASSSSMGSAQDGAMAAVASTRKAAPTEEKDLRQKQEQLIEQLDKSTQRLEEPAVMTIATSDKLTGTNAPIGNSERQAAVSSVPLIAHLQATSGTHSEQANQAANNHQWLSAAASVAHTQLSVQVRQRVSQASDQLGQSLRQLYASASNITAAVDVAPPPPLYQNLPGIVPYYQGRSIGPPPSYDDVINPYAPPPTYQSLFGQMREARKTSRGLVDLLRRLLIILASTLGCTLLIAFMILIPFTMIIIGAIYIDECKIEHIPAFLLIGGLVWASKNVLQCYSQCRKQSAAEQSAALVADQLYGHHYHSPSSSSSSSSTYSEPNSNSNEQQRQQQQRQSAGETLPMALEEEEMRLGSGSASWRNSSTRSERHLASSGATSQAAANQANANSSTRRLKSSICESLLNCVLFGWFIAGCVIVFRNYEPDFENSSSLRYCHRTVYMYTFWLITSAMILFGVFISCICCLMISSAVASRQDDIDLA